ncbi:FIST N-terminal domain-containing protein [Ramlibacter sp. PS3R-8]|uniref:FIST signal transduction protein n=1 Tax=Ramlibacter sp. PS3R-8 TaxID=3133437 RepID=UPI0030AE078A
MALFPYGHATHPQWQMAAGLVLAQLRAQLVLPGHANHPTLGLLYITDHYASQAREILDHLSAELPEVTDWSGTVGVGIAASNVEYFDEPALAVMLCAVPPDQYRVFSGVAPLTSTFTPHTALVHADAGTPDVAELIAEMADRTATGYLFGGLASSRSDVVQFAVGGNGNLQGHGKASGVFRGGLSGVAFGEGVQIVSRVTQGCQPIGAARRITGADGNLVVELDGKPALDVLLDDLEITLQQPQEAMAVLRATLVGLTQATEDVVHRTGHFGTDVVVRHIIGLDPRRRGVAIADKVDEGMGLAFCRRDVETARMDLVRICSEIREELEPEELPLALATMLAAPDPVSGPAATAPIAGAVYVSCSGRGGPHFGGPSAELQIVRRALGDVPLVGFFAGGEIARSHLYGYTGVLTVFR